MEIDEILRWTNGKITDNIKAKITGIETDTRKIKEGEIFVALKGVNFDGHNFVKEAFEKKASYSIVEKKITGMNEIIVKDSLFALGEIARNYRLSKNIKIIVVTGTVGKTTTKEYLYNIFKKRYKTIKNQKNYNNLIGVPLELLKISGEEYGIFEIGTNKMGEIKRLSEITHPDIGIITEISPVHLEFLNNMENIFYEKSSLLQYLKDKLIINGDNEYLSRIKFKNIIRVGFNKNNDYRITILEKNDNIIFKINEEEFRIKNTGIGSVICASYSIATAISEGFNIENIREGLNEELEIEHRMKIIKMGSLNIIDDTYNASPASMKNAIEFLSEKKKRIAVLGDMLELGDSSKEYHISIGEFLKGKTDILIAIGEYASYYIEGFGKGYFANDIDSVIDILLENTKNETWVLIKGSRKLQLERIIEKMKGILCYTTYTS